MKTTLKLNLTPKRVNEICAGSLFLLLLFNVANAQYSVAPNPKGPGVIITRYTGQGGVVVIPSAINGQPVTAIGEAAFFNTAVTAVAIPDSVTSVGFDAFGNTGVTNIAIGSGVTDLEPGRFGGPFFDCPDLLAITVSPGNPSYSSADGVLFDESQTKLIQCPQAKAARYAVPSKVTSIGGGAFLACAKLTSLTIPHSVITIGPQAFYRCNSLTNVVIGSGVTNVGNWWTFADCTSLTGITVDPLNPVYSSVDGVLLTRSQTRLMRCPEGKAGRYAIPSKVTDVGAYAFSGCASLAAVAIPASVSSVGSGAFQGCTRLRAITVDASNPFYSGVDGVLFDKNRTTLIQCPGGKAGTYAVPSTVTTIAALAFENCVNLATVTIPNSVTTIGDEAFGWCTSLTGVHFGGNAPSLGRSVFYSDAAAVLYYLPGTTGWGATFGGLPNVLWNLQVHSLGVRGKGFVFGITGPTNLLIVVEASSNLGDGRWVPLSTNILTGGSSFFHDPNWTDYPARFYRLRAPEPDWYPPQW
jgi:hypothetical protein